ncbi:MAG: hypothetical protein ACK5PF_02090, partial [bacterium]
QKTLQGPKEAVDVFGVLGETGARSLARALTEPGMRHAGAVNAFASRAIGGEIERPGAGAVAVARTEALKRAGDPKDSKRMLAAQAIALDATFTEMLRRSALNLADYPDAAERYLRLALKTQANARATVEALARLNEPSPAPPRFVSVMDGGQAVIGDQIHISGGQSHATTAIGPGPAMLGENPERWPMPSPGGEGQD